VLSKLRSRAKGAAAGLIRRTGYELRRTGDSPHAHVDAFLDQRRLLNAPRPVVFDVGANRGQSVERYLKVFPGAEIYAFEPGAAAYADLVARFASNQRVHPFRQALSDSAGEAAFHVNSADYTSSLLAAAAGVGAFVDARLLAEVERVRVQTTTLAAFSSEHSISGPDILKLDVQGAELLVLRGADPLLSRGAIAIVYTEVQFAPLYSGQCYFDEVSGFLRARGYSLFGLYDLQYGVNGLLAWADALFASQACLASGGLPTPSERD